VAFGLLALIVAAAVRIYGDLSWSSLGSGALTTSGCLLFGALAVLAVRSGALAGPYTGQVLSIGLTYVQLDTDEGVILLPNSGVLAAAVGPRSATPEM